MGMVWMSGSEDSPRDLRAYARSTTFRLGAGGLLVILIVGNLLVYFVYGAGGLMQSLLCMGAFLLPGLLIVGVLQLMSWIAKRGYEDGD